MIRTHNCGELTKQHVGGTVTLMGWVHGRRDHGGVLFIDLRDRYGVTQLVFDIDKAPTIHGQANDLRNEFVIAAIGQVRNRPEESINLELATGEIEVEVEDAERLVQMGLLARQFRADTKSGKRWQRRRHPVWPRATLVVR